MTRSRLAGHAVVEQLRALGADTAFCVPGESYLAVLDGIYDVRDEFRLVTCRQEGGAAMAAAAYGQLTGRPGIAMVTRGPGATNASSGVHVASQDASPMLLLVGQVPTGELGRRAFQEVDYRQLFGGLAKDVVQVERADRICEMTARAYTTATSGEPGPVVLALPEDVLMTETPTEVVPPRPAVDTGVSRQAVEEVAELLGSARRPLVVVGGTAWNAAGIKGLRAFAESSGVPVATATRRQDLVDNHSDAFAGTLGLRTTPGLAELAASADVLLLLGSRPDGLTVEDGDWLTAPQPRQRLAHVYPDPDILDSVFRTHVGVAARPDDFASALAEVSRGDAAAREPWLRELRDNRKRAVSAPVVGGDPRPYMAVLNDRLPPDAILTAGAGAYTAWHQRFRTYTTYPSQVSTESGSMGYGLPAAIASQLVYPEREVVAFAGDGCFLMTGQELSTAVRYGLGITVVVVNNAVYGTILGHQRRTFPGRPSGTDLQNPDFAALARAHGAHGTQVDSPEGFAEALDARPGGAVPSVIEVAFPYM